MGFPTERLEKIAQQDPLLSKWWKNFVKSHPEIEGYTKHQEITLATPLGEHRLVAKYDLILLNSKAYIYDWKTSRKLTKRKWLGAKLQTRVYPYVLVKAGAQLNEGETIDPEHIEMVYWFSNFPTSPIKFPYSREKYLEDEEYIHGLITEIEAMVEDVFPLTDNVKRCRFCNYRSLCSRGVAAGSLDELEDDYTEEEDFGIDIDFDQIAEIAF